MPAEVVMYRTQFCPYCVRAKQLLDRKGVQFEQVDVAGKYELRAWLVQATGRHTVPQIFINGAPIGGYDDMSALERAGKLDRLLAQDRIEARNLRR